MPLAKRLQASGKLCPDGLCYQAVNGRGEAIEMQWFDALWIDVVRHLKEFEIGPPRTLDQLVSWLTLLGMLYAFYRAIRQPLRRIGSNIAEGAQFSEFNEIFDKVAQVSSTLSGVVLEPGYRLLAIESQIDLATGLIIGAMSILALGAQGGPLATFATIGITLLLAVLCVSSWIDKRHVIRLARGGTSKYSKALATAEDYLKPEKDKLFENRPRRQAKRQKLRANLDHIKQQIAAMKATTS